MQHPSSFAASAACLHFFVWFGFRKRVLFGVGFRVFCSEFLRTGKFREGASERGGSRKKFLNTPICPLTRPLFVTIFEADRGVKEFFSRTPPLRSTFMKFSGSQKLRTKNPKSGFIQRPRFLVSLANLNTRVDLKRDLGSAPCGLNVTSTSLSWIDIRYSMYDKLNVSMPSNCILT